MARAAETKRKTTETEVACRIDLDGTGKTKVSTGVGFLDHMLELFGRHGLVDLDVKAKGDTHVDPHHTVEDVGIVLGTVIREALVRQDAAWDAGREADAVTRFVASVPRRLGLRLPR